MKASEVRKNWKSILDECVQTGKPIYFERAGTMFKIEAYVAGIQLPTPKIEPVATQQIINAKARMVAESIPTPSILPPTSDEFAEALDASEGECCRKNTPCKHWVWSPERVCYINSLSGRTREADE